MKLNEHWISSKMQFLKNLLYLTQVRATPEHTDKERERERERAHRQYRRRAQYCLLHYVNLSAAAAAAADRAVRSRLPLASLAVSAQLPRN